MQIVRVVVAWWALVAMDALSLFGFRPLYDVLRRMPVGQAPPSNSVAALASAVDEASIWYFKRVLCLQRSAALMALLRLRGIPARLVIGFRPVPLDSHAWVEVEGRIVNDRPQYKRFYTVLDTI